MNRFRAPAWGVAVVLAVVNVALFLGAVLLDNPPPAAASPMWGLGSRAFECYDEDGGGANPQRVTCDDAGVQNAALIGCCESPDGGPSNGIMFFGPLQTATAANGWPLCKGDAGPCYGSTLSGEVANNALFCWASTTNTRARILCGRQVKGY